MNILSRIYRACRVGPSWYRVVTLAGRGSYESALAEIENTWKYWDNRPPPQYQLLRAYLECHLGRNDLAIIHVTDAYNALTAKQWYSQNQNSYLTNYAAKFGNKIIKTKDYRDKDLFSSDLPPFNIDKVSSFNRKVFSLEAL